MKKLIKLLVLLCGMNIVFFSCDKDSPTSNSTEPVGELSIHVVMQNDSLYNPQHSILVMDTAIVTIIASDRDTLQYGMVVDDNSALDQQYTLLAGVNRTIRVELKNMHGLVLFSGQATTNIDAGQSKSINVNVDYNPLLGVMTDNNGYEYITIKIGNQVWMAENLLTTKYRNGEQIEYVADSLAWSTTYETNKSAYCYYNNDMANAKIYGYLYNWYAISDTRGIAPEGWHVPTNEDWETLIAQNGGIRFTGKTMKQAGAVYWHELAETSSNKSGFSAAPAGLRWWDGSFGNIFYRASFWSITDLGYGSSYSFSIYNHNDGAGLGDHEYPCGLSVRLIKD